MNNWQPEQHITKEQRNFMYHAFTGDVAGLKKDFEEQHAVAYINLPQEDKTALYWTAVNLFPEAVELLLKYGADPFIRPPKGVNAGMTVLQSVRAEVWEKRIKPLMDKGETLESLKQRRDKYLAPYEKVTALLAAAEYQRVMPLINKARISPEKFATENNRLQRFGEHKIVDGVHYWVEKKTGLVMPAMAEDGMSALHVAVARGNEKLVKDLIGRNADINERNRLGLRPIEIAEILQHNQPELQPIYEYIVAYQNYKNPGRVQVSEVRDPRAQPETGSRVTRKVKEEKSRIKISISSPNKPVGF